MRHLHHLRLNCLLIPALIGGMAAAAVYFAHHTALRHLTEERQADLAHAIGAWAGLRGQGIAISPAHWRASDARWLAAAELRLRDDHLLISAASGPHSLGADPPAALPDAISAPQCWRTADGHRLAAAAVIRPYTEASPVFVYAETAEPMLPGLGLWPALAGIAALSLALGWYLVRHLWRPFEALQRHAEAALRGETPPAGAGTSEETEAVRSSVIMLAERYRSSHATPGVGGPPPPPP